MNMGGRVFASCPLFWWCSSIHSLESWNALVCISLERYAGEYAHLEVGALGELDSCRLCYGRDDEPHSQTGWTFRDTLPMQGRGHNVSHAWCGDGYTHPDLAYVSGSGRSSPLPTSIWIALAMQAYRVGGGPEGPGWTLLDVRYDLS